MSEPSCPHCGEPVEPRQLVCTSCGGRVALGERAPFGREPLPAAAVVLIVVTALSAFLLGLGISDLTGGDDGGGSGGGEQVSATTKEAPKQETETETTAEEPQAPAVVTGSAQDKQAPRRQRGVPGWPKGLTASTVVLVTSSDRGAALNVARRREPPGSRPV